MFVNDRLFFTLDPARNLYSTFAYYTSTCAANSLTSVFNAAIFMLLMYSLSGEAKILHPQGWAHSNFVLKEVLSGLELRERRKWLHRCFCLQRGRLHRAERCELLLG